MKQKELREKVKSLLGISDEAATEYAMERCYHGKGHIEGLLAALERYPNDARLLEVLGFRKKN